MSEIVQVLDHGFVRLDGVFGDDRDIARIARQSTGGGNKSETRDKNFLDYLWRHRHASPFEMPVMRFELKAPIFVMRQLVRHRTHSMNEYSGRYSEMIDETYLPEVDRIQTQGTDNRQGSGEPIDPDRAELIRRVMEGDQKDSRYYYEKYLEADVAKELARINLPAAQYTLLHWQQNLRNLLATLRLRLDDHAQYEIRAYAEAIYGFVQEHFPWTCEAFENWDVRGHTFSGEMMDILRRFVDTPGKRSLLRAHAQTDLRKSHAREFLAALEVDEDGPR